MDIVKRQQYYGLDVAKLIAAVFVIGAHTHPLAGMEGSPIYALYSFFLSLSVPLFALTSGYLVSRKLRWEADPQADLQILKKALYGLLRLYVIWNLIHLPISFQEPLPDGKPLYLVIIRYVINFFFVGEQYLSWQFWYLLANIYGLILLIFLRKWNGKAWLLGISAFAVLLLSFYLYLFIDSVHTYTGIRYTLSMILGEVFVNGRLLGGISYILAGAFLGRLRLAPKPIPCVLLLALGLCLNLFDVEISVALIRYLTSPVYAVCLFLLCLQWQGVQEKPWLLACRKASTVFYFTHMFWFYVGYVLLDPIPTFTFWGAPAFFWCLLTSSITAVAVVKFRNTKLVKLLF